MKMSGKNLFITIIGKLLAARPRTRTIINILTVVWFFKADNKVEKKIVFLES